MVKFTKPNFLEQKNQFVTMHYFPFHSSYFFPLGLVSIAPGKFFPGFEHSWLPKTHIMYPWRLFGPTK